MVFKLFIKKKLAYHPVYLGWKLASCICLFGFLSLYLNYDADRQRYLARQTNGKCLIWNKEPVLIRAKYLLLGKKIKCLKLTLSYDRLIFVIGRFTL